jgi:nicotinamide-nucleotide adenylyltransferase
MSAPRRTLFVWDGQSLRQEQLDMLLEASCSGDEIVIALLQAEEGLTSAQPLTGGQRIARLSSFLRKKLNTPTYLLPLKTCQLSTAQLAQRLRFDVPAFAHLITSSPDLERAASALLGCTIQLVKPENGPDLLVTADSARRGLFITRAQPFHLGHAACVKKISEEMDEVIVLVALAESSHTTRNPATAGERLEMIHPYLQRTLPGRFHLAAAPYETHTACNVSELQLLLPTFECIYTNSPSTQALAASAGVTCRAIHTSVDVSGTQVRRALLDERRLDGLVPIEVASVLSRIALGRRLQLLASKEVRRED